MTFRIDHVSVTTGSLDRSIAFYRDVLGLPFKDRGEASQPELSTLTGLEDVRVRWAEFDLGGDQLLEVLEYVSPLGDPVEPRPNRPGATHIGLAVDDLTSIAARLVDAGVALSDRPVTLSEDGEWHGVRVLYVRDPDGVSIELVERDRAAVRIPELDISNVTTS
jgi:catechol 2,3-dioxygenase-like lactoylglutathione lyase family enzyme